MNTNYTVSCRSKTAVRGAKGGALCFGLCALGIALSASADQKLRITTFDAPGAGTGVYQGTDCPGCSSPVNTFGVLAGLYIDASGMTHGFLRSPWGGITSFDVPGENPTYGIGCAADCPLGLNDGGAITGTYLDANYVYHGFLRSADGRVITFDAPGADTTPGDANGTFAVSINDQGAITGYYIDAKNVYHGFVALPSESR